jgi:hypothetical protein
LIALLVAIEATYSGKKWIYPGFLR